MPGTRSRPARSRRPKRCTAEEQEIRDVIAQIRRCERSLTGRSDYRGPPHEDTPTRIPVRSFPSSAPLRWYRRRYRAGLNVCFVPTPQRVVNRMLELAAIRRGDLVYDLGCGDGRIVTTAARKHKARAVGFDIDPERVRESRAKVEKAGMQQRVKIKEANVFKVALRRADVVMLYLLCSMNKRLLPQLRKLRPGARVVSHDFWIEGVRPKEVVEMKVDGRLHTIYTWVAPLEKD